MSSKHDDWDYENPEVKPGRKNPSTVYSVRFPKAEMAAVRAAARAAGMTTSEFIREAAREKAEGRVPITHEPRVETGAASGGDRFALQTGSGFWDVESLPD